MYYLRIQKMGQNNLQLQLIYYISTSYISYIFQIGTLVGGKLLEDSKMCCYQY